MITLGIGQMNIAVGGIGGLVAIAFGGAMEVYGLPLALAVPFALAIGALAGLINGMLIARSGVNAFIITLATVQRIPGSISASLARSPSTRCLPRWWNSAIDISARCPISSWRR